VNDPSLAPGTEIEITDTLTADLSSSTDHGTCSIYALTTGMMLGDGNIGYGGSVDGGDLSVMQTSGTATGVFYVYNGRTFYPTGQLHFLVDAGPYPFGGFESASADVDGTASFMLSAQPGVTFTSLSGHDYSVAAVPEASSLIGFAMLLGLGALLIVVPACRRRTSLR
jgi:hypothetical protein